MKSMRDTFNVSNGSIIVLLMLFVFASCTDHDQTKENTSYDLYKIFQDPPTEARPFVRWWWNGNKVNATEIDRELEVLQKIGFGGVEINPIGMNSAIEKPKDALVWMSDEWIDMLVHAAKKSKDLGMITDMIVGTGWPFGGEFLQHEETCQRVVPHTIKCKGGETITFLEDTLWDLYTKAHTSRKQFRKLSKRTTHELFYIKLIPENCEDLDDIIDLQDYLKNGKLSYEIKGNRNYYLSYGYLLQSFRNVAVGAPGGAGPVMDHYRKEITQQYLSRLNKITERSGIPLSELIRALFCDSIEVSGANWTDDFAALFFETYGYSLDHWKPFVFYPFYDGYTSESYDNKFSSEFKKKLKRVRYDYNKLLVDTFLENFTQVFKDFCEEKNVLCRYQAYGTPFLMGMLDGYMIPDIPESNNWVYSGKMKDPTWAWSQGKGTMIWNMYTSAAAHLGGKKIASCESMTNTNGVFKTTLEEIKQHDDMNFITGMNHTILHGYNYSPPEVEFPGWVRYGAYFSEYNPWWKHLDRWIDYNARLSAIFQNSQPSKSIAIIGPTADVWGNDGLTRTKYHVTPQYLYKLWEPISQLGYSCEYINLRILENSTVDKGTLVYGNMRYNLLVLASLTSINPETALKLQDYIKSGGKLVIIDQLPNKSLHLNNYQKNDEIVTNTIESMVSSYDSQIIQLKAPETLDNLFSWTRDLLMRSNIESDVKISNPTEKVYQIYQYTPSSKIYFFTNVHRNESAVFDAEFPADGKYPWVWNPETGERKPFYFKSNATELRIDLDPLESLLLVFEDEKPDSEEIREPNPQIASAKTIDANWTVTGNRVDKKKFVWDISELMDFSKSEDSTKMTFGGELIYKTRINNDGVFTHIDLGDVNEGVTELVINGKYIAKKWYGKAVYAVSEHLQPGENDIEIRYATVLANYSKYISDKMLSPSISFQNIKTPLPHQQELKVPFDC